MTSEFIDEPQSPSPGQVRSSGTTASTGATGATGQTGQTGAAEGTVWDTDPGQGIDRGPGSTAGQSAKDTAKEQASGVVKEGVEGGKQMASVAADQAKQVASEAGQQAKMLLDQARSELMEHASSQQSRIADQLRALSQELGTMASKSDQDGVATDLARQASRQVGSVAHWLSEREPGSLVTELKDFARTRPGTFLAIAAGVGVVAGRMTRSVQAGAPDDGPSGRPIASGRTTTYPMLQSSGSVWDDPSGAGAAGTSPFAAQQGGKLDGGWQDNGQSEYDDGDSGLVPASPAAARARYDDGSSPETPRAPGTTGLTP